MLVQLARYSRGGLEFDRVGSPPMPSLPSLGEIPPQLFSLLLAFLLLANYWMVQHSFVSRVEATIVI